MDHAQPSCILSYSDTVGSYKKNGSATCSTKRVLFTKSLIVLLIVQTKKKGVLIVASIRDDNNVGSQTKVFYFHVLQIFIFYIFEYYQNSCMIL